MLQELKSRSGNCCELCGATENLSMWYLPWSNTKSRNDG